MQRALGAGIFILLMCNPAVLPAQTEPEKELAQKRYKVGEQLYTISQYQKALVEFEEAYRLYPMPGMLFNIARCHEVLANLLQAIDAYKLYLAKKPDAPNASVVKSRIKSLEQRLAQNKAAAAAAREAAAREAVKEKPKPAPAPPVVVKEPPRPERTWRWTAGWTGVGVGGAALVAGIIFGALAAHKSSEFDDLNGNNGVYDDLQPIRESGQRYETLQMVLMTAGGVIAAAGGGLLTWELLGQEDQPGSARVTMAPVVTHQGLGFAASLSF